MFFSFIHVRYKTCSGILPLRENLTGITRTGSWKIQKPHEPKSPKILPAYHRNVASTAGGQHTQLMEGKHCLLIYSDKGTENIEIPSKVFRSHPFTFEFQLLI